MVRLEVLAPGARGILARRRAPAVGLGSVTGDYYAALQGRLQSLGAQGAATLKTATGVDVTQTRVATGATAALSLAEHGYDPNSTADNQALVAAIAGGLCLVPVVGPALGAAVEALYQVGNAVACPTMKLAADLGLGDLPPACGGAPCRSTGNWSAASIISASGKSLPERPTGSFAELAVAALATYAAQAANCQASLPPGVIIDAAVQIWNKTHAGPAAQFLVPPLNMVNKGIVAFGPPTIINVWQGISGSGSAPSLRAGMDPYAMYAFGPTSSIPASEHPHFGNTLNPAQLWAVAPQPIYNIDPPRFVSVNTGALIQSTGQPSRVATVFQPGHVYLMLQTGLTAATDEGQFIAMVQTLGFTPVQILWWGPTGTLDDPKGYTAGQTYTDRTTALLLATYTKAQQSVPPNSYVLDMTGLMTPQQTVLGQLIPAQPASSTPAASKVVLVAAGGVAAVVAGGTLWALIQKQAVGYFWGKVFDKVIEGGRSLAGRVG